MGEWRLSVVQCFQNVQAVANLAGFGVGVILCARKTGGFWENRPKYGGFHERYFDNTAVEHLKKPEKPKKEKSNPRF